MSDLVVRQTYTDMQQAGQVANVYAQSNVWEVYHQEITDNTRKRQWNDLASYCTYLQAMGIVRTPEELFTNPTPGKEQLTVS